MAETVARFETPVRDREGLLYSAKVCGRERDDGLWEGWIEFENIETNTVVRTERETTQPNYADLKYWATGLSAVYLEGALDRVLRPPAPRPSTVVPPPAYDGPLERNGRHRSPYPDAILDPFSVYEKSPDLLARELTALRAWHLRQIIKEYELADGDMPLEALSEPELGSLIVRRVRELRA